MRQIKLHRRASQYLQRMLRDRQVQMVSVLEEVAGYADISTHLGIRKLTTQDGWFRLRVGMYRAILPDQLERSKILTAMGAQRTWRNRILQFLPQMKRIYADEREGI